MAFYIAGTDHCRRATSEGEPDTLQKIERELSVMRGESRRNHAVSFLFLERGEAMAGMDSLDSFLDMHVLPSIPLSCSSTAIRKSMRIRGRCTSEVAPGRGARGLFPRTPA